MKVSPASSNAVANLAFSLRNPYLWRVVRLLYSEEWTKVPRVNGLVFWSVNENSSFDPG